MPEKFMLIGDGWSGWLYQFETIIGTQWSILVTYRNGQKTHESHGFIFYYSVEQFCDMMDETWGGN